ncbi:unnamed protein product [Owenia fusiformis]|uniref:Carboxylic ester hydrolase n=1 Tax=Owenia fusiformis TaxID=6347 RepID=A0A8J1UQT1_OWEFU|nr:unnamed protein product [Owenia fusiformis]
MNMNISLIVHFIVLLALVEGINSALGKQVVSNTRYGRMRGHSISTTYANKTLEVYTGIPYAAPPIGNLRWSNPQPPKPWGPGILDTLSFKPACPQSLYSVRSWSFGSDWSNTNEDCLYLNIYSPKGGDPLVRYPVFVWIYGGYFSTGAAEEYDGRVLAVEKDVVVVTISYRVGVLGYLATDDVEAKGNYGQLDQVRALEWVQENIINFRGNPDNITIGGESSGAVSATMHLFSPLTRGLFHAVIAQSGQANSYWAIKRDRQTARSYAFELGRLVGCNQTSSKELISCMRGKSASELVERGNNDVTYPLFGPLWGPVIDGYYILEDPEDLITRGEFLNVPMLTGVNKDDASYELDYVVAPAEGYSRDFLLSLFNGYSNRWDEKQGFMFDAFAQEYNPDPYGNVDRNRNIYVEFQTDHSYTAPAIYHATGHSAQVSNTYFYNFIHRSINSPEPVEKGVIHGAELDYIFGIPFFTNETCPWGCNTIRWVKQVWTKQDKEISRMMMTQWANFMKTGNPNIPEKVPKMTVSWPEFSHTEEKYLTIANESYEARYHRYRKVKFWNEYVEKLNNKLNNITMPTSDGCIIGGAGRGATLLYCLFLLCLS